MGTLFIVSPTDRERASGVGRDRICVYTETAAGSRRESPEEYRSRRYRRSPSRVIEQRWRQGAERTFLSNITLQYASQRYHTTLDQCLESGVDGERASPVNFDFVEGVEVIQQARVR